MIFLLLASLARQGTNTLALYLIPVCAFLSVVWVITWWDKQVTKVNPSSRPIHLFPKSCWTFQRGRIVVRCSEMYSTEAKIKFTSKKTNNEKSFGRERCRSDSTQRPCGLVVIYQREIQWHTLLTFDLSSWRFLELLDHTTMSHSKESEGCVILKLDASTNRLWWINFTEIYHVSPSAINNIVRQDAEHGH